MFGVKSLLMDEKVLMMRNDRVVSTTDASQRSIPSCDQTGVWWDKCLHEFRRSAEKWNVTVWRLNTSACWTRSLSRLTHNAVQHLRVAKENCWEKYFTDWLRSMYKCMASQIGFYSQLPISAIGIADIANKCKKKLQFIHKLTASDTSKTAKITKRWLPHQHIA